MRQFLGILMVVAALGACTKFPELDAAVSDEAKAADYPKLIPAAQIEQNQPKGRLSDTEGEALLARAARLRQRGAILRGLPVIDEAARLRFSRVLKSLGG